MFCLGRRQPLCMGEDVAALAYGLPLPTIEFTRSRLLIAGHLRQDVTRPYIPPITS
jgi:hypothetical protein